MKLDPTINDYLLCGLHQLVLVAFLKYEKSTLRLSNVLPISVSLDKKRDISRHSCGRNGKEKSDKLIIIKDQPFFENLNDDRTTVNLSKTRYKACG